MEGEGLPGKKMICELVQLEENGIDYLQDALTYQSILAHNNPWYESMTLTAFTLDVYLPMLEHHGVSTLCDLLEIRL